MTENFWCQRRDLRNGKRILKSKHAAQIEASFLQVAVDLHEILMWMPWTSSRPSSAFVAKPKTLRVIEEQLYSRRPSIAEHEHIAGERIRFQCLLAESSQTINSTAEIGRFHGNQNAHLGSELEMIS
jgi:hypothetical protein